MEKSDRLKTLRTCLGLSQEEVGSKLGVTRSSVSNMESGRYNITDTLAKLICSEFGISKDWFETGEGDMFPDYTDDDALAALFAEVTGGHRPGIRSLAVMYSNLSIESRQKVDEVLDELLNSQEDKSFERAQDDG